MNVQIQTHRAITAILGKKVVIFLEIFPCDEEPLTAQIVQRELILKRMMTIASFTLRNAWFMESAYRPVLLHVI
jgi:hypothetical protein